MHTISSRTKAKQYIFSMKYFFPSTKLFIFHNKLSGNSNIWVTTLFFRSPIFGKKSAKLFCKLYVSLWKYLLTQWKIFKTRKIFETDIDIPNLSAHVEQETMSLNASHSSHIGMKLEFNLLFSFGNINFYKRVSG